MRVENFDCAAYTYILEYLLVVGVGRGSMEGKRPQDECGNFDQNTSCT